MSEREGPEFGLKCAALARLLDSVLPLAERNRAGVDVRGRDPLTAVRLERRGPWLVATAGTRHAMGMCRAPITGPVPPPDGWSTCLWRRDAQRLRALTQATWLRSQYPLQEQDDTITLSLKGHRGGLYLPPSDGDQAFYGPDPAGYPKVEDALRSMLLVPDADLRQYDVRHRSLSAIHPKQLAPFADAARIHGGDERGMRNRGAMLCWPVGDRIGRESGDPRTGWGIRCGRDFIGLILGTYVHEDWEDEVMRTVEDWGGDVW